MEDQTAVDQIIEGIEKVSPPLLTRIGIQRVTDGAVSAKYLANIDSLNSSEAIPNRVKCGRRVAYPTPSFLVWFRKRLEVANPNKQGVA